ncbi:MAG: hypothetical protein FWD29_07975 [Micrococcales bacterium]|nr:hypothetical protein [Micrococcales bacterium]
MTETTRASNVYPVGVSVSAQCRLFQILDDTAGPVTVSDLDALFGQVGATMEPGLSDTGFWYGGVEYSHEVFSIVFAFSEENDGEYLGPDDLVLAVGPRP